jgi:glutamate racemase
MRNMPIGVFDSGVGGLTVVRSLIDRLPREHMVYLGDDARGPYGPRDPEEVRGFAREIIDYMLGFDVKLVVIACNSATAAALEEAQRDYTIPIVGVILPGVRGALRRSKNRRIGVIGTVLTVESGSYETAIRKLDPGVEVISRACPDFVDFVERGEVDGEHIVEIARGYLSQMVEAGVDTVILGCTHYPMLEALIQRIVGDGVALISSADETAEEVADILGRLGWFRNDGSAGTRYFLATGDAEKCAELGRMFLGPEVREVMRVSFDMRPDLGF